MRNGAKIISALCFLGLVNYLDRVVISFAGPSIMASLAMSPAHFGIILSSFSVGYLLAQVPGGLLADRFGARALLIVGPIFWAIFTGATGLVSSLASFVLVRFLFGCSEGLSQPSLYKTVGENFEPDHRARAIGLTSTAVPLAPFLAGAIVGKLIGAFSWQTTFLIMAFPALLVALCNYLLIPGRPDREATVEKHGGDVAMRDILARPGLWWLSIAAFAWNIPYWGFLGWMPSYLSMARHIDLTKAGPIAGIPYFFAFIGLLVGGWLGSGPLRRHCTHLLLLTFVGQALGFFLAYTAGNLGFSLAGLSISAFFMFGATGPIGRIVLDQAPNRRRGTFVGVYNTAGHLGGAVAPAAIGGLVSLTGNFAAGFELMVASLFLAGICITGLLTLQRRTAPPQNDVTTALDYEIGRSA